MEEILCQFKKNEKEIRSLAEENEKLTEEIKKLKKKLEES